MSDKKNLLDMEQSQMEKFLINLGEKPFHAGQIMQWIYKGAAEFGQMSDLSKGLREKLNEHAAIGVLKLKNESRSASDNTIKYLFEVPGGDSVESVLMDYHHGAAACISSQVGCKMGCAFCASSRVAFSRNLSAGEMTEQVLKLEQLSGRRIGSVVVMGIGEPLDNYDNLLRFLRIINSEKGLNIGYRHLTVSTCGLVPMIERFSNEGIPVNLSVSLHASNDSIRSKLMPINKMYAIDKLIEVCKIYLARTGRRITFEYILIDGLNDSDRDASELAARLRGLICHVNLIPYNEVDGVDFKTSPAKKVQHFKRLLEASGIPATVRRKLGDDIEAACGQLRRRDLKNGEC